MSDLDERIRQALETDGSETFSTVDTDASIFQTIGDTFRGRNRVIVAMVYVSTTVFSVLLLWAAYRFFTATDPAQATCDGILMLATMLCVVGEKMWYWMEMNRVTLMRELKRVELQLAELRRQAE